MIPLIIKLRGLILICPLAAPTDVKPEEKDRLIPAPELPVSELGQITILPGLEVLGRIVT